jgi:hypothetical protein
MTAISTRSAEIEAQVEAYRAALLATGMYAGRPVGSVARAWLKRVGFAGWARLDLVQQCATPLSERRLVSWLMVIGQLHPSPEYLIFGRPYLGEVAARHHRPFYVASVPPPLRSVRSAIHHSAVVSDHQSGDLARSGPGRAHAGGTGVRS